MAKERIPTEKFHLFTKPQTVAVITSMGKDKKTNAMPASWVMPVSVKPPLIAIAIKPSRYTYTLIKESQEFVVCFMPMEKANAVLGCGRVSGRETDKFRHFSLNKEPSEHIKTPRIKEAYVDIECKVNSSMKMGDHHLIIGEVLNVKAEQGILKDDYLDLKEIKPLLHVGSNVFCSTSDFVLKPKL